MSNDQPQRGFDFYWNNIPGLVADEQNPARYLRAFDAMTTGRSDDVDYLHSAARSAIAFIAENAFQAGCTAFYEDKHRPYVEQSVRKDEALAAMTAHGERVRRRFSDHFEDGHAPTAASVAIDELTLPTPTLPEATR